MICRPSGLGLLAAVFDVRLFDAGIGIIGYEKLVGVILVTHWHLCGLSLEGTSACKCLGIGLTHGVTSRWRYFVFESARRHSTIASSLDGETPRALRRQLFLPFSDN